MKTNWTENPLSQVFFSDTNKQRLQAEIIQSVYDESKGNYKIGPQSNTELEIIMRSIFMQYSTHQPDSIEEQVQDLNQKILGYCVPNILTNIKQFAGYQKTIDTLPGVMDHPQNMSNSGTKTLMNPLF